MVGYRTRNILTEWPTLDGLHLQFGAKMNEAVQLFDGQLSFTVTPFANEVAPGDVLVKVSEERHSISFAMEVGSYLTCTSGSFRAIREMREIAIYICPKCQSPLNT